MTTDRKSTTEPGPNSAKPWYPERPMGLARALNKAGFGTRKQTTEMIARGGISVDGDIVGDPLFPVTPESIILINGKKLYPSQKSYFLFHKPARVVSDPEGAGGRKLITDFFPAWVPGLQAAGRLDGRTTGLMLVSNDTAWNNRVASLLKPEQEFRVQVEGELGNMEVSVISASIHLPGMGIFRPLSVKIIEVLNGKTVLNIVVKEGKIRQIRRMFSTLRHEVVFLRRIRFGDIRLADLPSGRVRALTASEIKFIENCPLAKSNAAKGK